MQVTQIRTGTFSGREERVSEDSGGRNRATFERMLVIVFTPGTKKRREMVTLLEL